MRSRLTQGVSCDGDDLEIGVARQNHEVAIAMENGHPRSDRGDRDEAVADPAPEGLSAGGTCASKLGCLLVTGQTAKRQHGEREQQPPQLLDHIRDDDTREDFSNDHLSHRKWLARDDRSMQTPMNFAARFSDQLDPRRRVDDDQRSSIGSEPRTTSSSATA